MRTFEHTGTRSEERQDLLGSEPAQGVGSQEIDRSLAAVMREIAWSLAGCLGFVVGVQLLLHAFRVV